MANRHHGLWPFATDGDAVQVTYESRGDKKVVTEIDRRAKMMDGTESTNFGARGNEVPATPVLEKGR